jgi:hypothetical protein
MRCVTHPLVIDKSFAHAIDGDRLLALSAKYSFVVPSAFYYEVFDPKSAKRSQSLTGLGEFRRVHIPSLLRLETESGQPAREADLPRFTVNPKVLSSDWKLSLDELAIVQRHKIELVEPLLRFWNSVIDHGVIGFSGAELRAARGTEREFITLCETLRDPNRIRMIAAKIAFPHFAILDETWLHYRKFQTWILQGLILWRRYQTSADLRSTERIEHDTHDLEYLMLGLHAGNLATCETSEKLNKASMGWRFKLLRPNGRLVTTKSGNGRTLI